MTYFFVSDPISFYSDQTGFVPAIAVEISDEQYNAAMEGQSQGKVIQADKNGYPIVVDPPKPTKEQTIVVYEAAAQSNLDSVAQSWGYSSMVAAASYANSTNPQYKADADALIAWRDSYWAKAYQVEAGTLPKTAAEFVALLPEAPTQPTSN